MQYRNEFSLPLFFHQFFWKSVKEVLQEIQSNTEPAGESAASSSASEEPSVPRTIEELMKCETPVNCSEVSSELEAIAKRGARARLHMIWKTFIPTQRALRKRRKEKPPLRAIANQHVLERENKARPLSVRKMEYEPTRFRSTAKDR
ncbi:hypothetical protein AVEN_240571-1 [Araneus ventricosus]|uniref:Uncharacterized protein n=1 Tax=Araneus ventricosus TaxID=182803 RepID=A0A4Y2GS25_ARAVE|nr:hypothetical protein AVEN_240571-1 [Araneus ventricosus]